MARTPPVSEILDSQPPCDKDAERGVLASVMLDPGRRPEVAEILWPGSFYVDAHRILYAHLLDMESVDMILLTDRLRTAGELEAIGGPAYLAEILASVAVPNHAKHYARIVSETAKKREMLDLNKAALVALYSEKWTVAELAKRQADKLLEIANRKGEP
jgi:replicative DNA helicase